MINEENLTFAISPFYSKAIKLIKIKKTYYISVVYYFPHSTPMHRDWAIIHFSISIGNVNKVDAYFEVIDQVL